MISSKLGMMAYKASKVDKKNIAKKKLGAKFQNKQPIIFQFCLNCGFYIELYLLITFNMLYYPKNLLYSVKVFILL
jgi:hypothetical protein